MSEDKIILEACVDNLQQAHTAFKAGAHRIELCSDLHLDGLTPKLDVVHSAVRELNIPIKVMIRPRAGNFIYSNNERKVMRESILNMISAGVSQFVTGALTATGEIDTETLEGIVEGLQNVHFTFHKAIDRVVHPFRALETIDKISSFTSILTSGGKMTALEGADMIRTMEMNWGNRFEIIAAGKITWMNLEDIRKKTGCKSFHGKNIVLL
ncbi:MAG TPA: copper homeostasis protein CutC [Saprospiraceae bacterium]|nr:copper homeostasis protein CutC [Saprospiraceae bacterium]